MQRSLCFGLALGFAAGFGLAACNDSEAGSAADTSGAEVADTAATETADDETSATETVTAETTSEPDVASETTSEPDVVAADTSEPDVVATETTPDDVAADLAPEPPIAPSTAITAPAGTWTWVAFPDAVCDDGSATGIGVNLAPASDNLLVFFMGGGACWDYLTCYQLNTTTHGPAQQAQFDAVKDKLKGVLDRNDAKNPFRDWNIVFIPYCTGDLHTGDRVATYTDNSGSITKEFHHAGHANVRAYLARLGATFPSPQHLAVTGASAGGFGALFNYALFRDTLTPDESMLVDDSGPPLGSDAIPEFERVAWAAEWGSVPLLHSLCGAGCEDDYARVPGALAARFPLDRLSLLSSLQDRTISGYLLTDGPTFEGYLRAFLTNVLAPIATMRAFVITGNSHTMLGNPGAVAGLWDWLAAQLSGTNWNTVIPPPN